MLKTPWRRTDHPLGPLEGSELAAHMAEVEALLVRGAVSTMPTIPRAFVNLHDEELAREFSEAGFGVCLLPPNSGGPLGKPYRWEADVPERYFDIALRVAQQQRVERRAA